MLIAVLICCLLILGLGIGGAFYWKKKVRPLLDSIGMSPPIPEIDLSSVLDTMNQMKEASNGNYDKIAKAIKETPNKTLKTIQSSGNTTKGKLGEMMQWLELQRSYDRLIVVGSIVDFIGVKLTGDDPCIDFIDIKTGKAAALSSDQRKLRDFIRDHPEKITFKTVKVDIA